MSRRAPSARDPRNVGVTRTIPAVNRATKGASATRLASPLARPIPNGQVPPSGGSAAALLGYAEVRIQFDDSTDYASDNTSLSSTSDSTFDTEVGDSGVTLVGGTLGYAQTGPGFYAVTGLLHVHTGAPYVADVTEFRIYDPVLGDQVGSMITYGTRHIPYAGSYLVTDPLSDDPTVTIRCTGGDDRTFSGVYLDLYIARFAVPA